MPDKRKRRAPATRREEASDFVPADGLIGRFVDNVCDNPAMSGGLFVMALTASAIVSNAMFLQNVRHPEPLFSTRPPLVVERHAPAVPAPTPIPPRRDDQTDSLVPPLPRAAPVRTSIAGQIAIESELREIQAILAKKGLYLGAIDGVYGSLSRTAIVAYEKAEGLAVTGEPSESLLEHLKITKTAVLPEPPQPQPQVSQPQGPQAPTPQARTPQAMAATMPAEAPPPAPMAYSEPPPQAAPMAVNAPVQQLPEIETTVADGQRLRIERVQTALNRIGYGPVVVNGIADDETINAIRRFELDNGLPVSGNADDGVVDRLIKIGALPAI